MRELLERRSDHRSLPYDALSAHVDIGQISSNYAGRLNYGLVGGIYGDIRLKDEHKKAHLSVEDDVFAAAENARSAHFVPRRLERKRRKVNSQFHS